MNEVLGHAFFSGLAKGGTGGDVSEQLDKIIKEQERQGIEQRKQTAMLTAIDSRTKNLEKIGLKTLAQIKKTEVGVCSLWAWANLSLFNFTHVSPHQTTPHRPCC